MKKYVLIASALLITQVTQAETLSAIMTFESMTITTEGVKKQTEFQERFIRDKDTVWSERIIPKKVAKDNSNQESHDHDHDLNFATAAKWLSKDKNDQIIFRFVRTQEQKIIEPRTSEYGTLGFDGVWETAYYLINRANLKKMTSLTLAAPKDAHWYEKQDARLFTRVLWDEKRQIPLKIQSGNLDGTMDNKITIAITSSPTALPWTGLATYHTIAYEDLLD